MQQRMGINGEMRTHGREDPPGLMGLPRVESKGRIVVLGRSESGNGSSGSGEEVNKKDFGISIGTLVSGDDFEDYLFTYLQNSSTKDASTNVNRDKLQASCRMSKTDLDTNSNKNGFDIDNNRGKKPQIVSRLPWQDQGGVPGKYTGQIDCWMRPHGCGALIYGDGSFVTSTWEGGVAIKSWEPWEVKKEKKQQPERRRLFCADSTVEKHQAGSQDCRSENATGTDSPGGGEIAVADGTEKNQQHRSSGSDGINISRKNSTGTESPSGKRQPWKQRQSSGDSGQNEVDCSGRRSSSSEKVEGSIKDSPTYLSHLDLGDVGAPRDMIVLESSEPIVLGTVLESHLKIHDYAFVLRSDSRWTYAIVAEKHENGIVFVVDGDGRTKAMARNHLAASIRLVNPKARSNCGDGGGGGGSESNSGTS